MLKQEIISSRYSDVKAHLKQQVYPDAEQENTQDLEVLPKLKDAQGLDTMQVVQVCGYIH